MNENSVGRRDAVDTIFALFEVKFNIYIYNPCER